MNNRDFFYEFASQVQKELNLEFYNINFADGYMVDHEKK